MRRAIFLRSAWRYAAALALVGLFTGLVALVRAPADVANASMLYLLAVLASAVLFGSGPAIAAAVASFLAFNFFFVEPKYTFNVSEGEEWVALVLLLVSGITTGQLAALLRQRAQEAQRREKEASVLYDVVRLMGEPDIHGALSGVAERLRAELGLAGVVVVLGGDVTTGAHAEAGDAEAIRLASEAEALAEMILGRGPAPTGAQRGKPGRWIRVIAPQKAPRGRPTTSRRVSVVPVLTAGARGGSLILVRREDAPMFVPEDDRLLSAVAQQLGLALERLRLREQATQAEVLRRTDELRTALLDAVSHDLRSPLSSIIASAGSLEQTDVAWSEEEKREFIGSISSEADRLNRLVGNLLDLSRIESGAIHPEKGWFDLPSLVREVVQRMNRLVEGHPLEVLLPDEMPPVQFDCVEMDQVISNLVENAVRHTPAGTPVRVSAVATATEVEVAVEDNGPGISAIDLPQIFKPFYRGGAGRGAGSGLGLAIARGLVEAHGGRIWAENKPGGGARFAFALPLGKRPAAAA